MHSHKQLLEDKETAGGVVLKIFVLLDRVCRSEIHCKTNHMPSLHVFLLDQVLSTDTVFSSFSSNCFISLGETSYFFLSRSFYSMHVSPHNYVTPSKYPCKTISTKAVKHFLSNYGQRKHLFHYISTTSLPLFLSVKNKQKTILTFG